MPAEQQPKSDEKDLGALRAAKADGEDPDDEEWVGGPTVKFLGRAEKEMQIGFQETVHLFLAGLRQRHPFVAVGGATAVPE